MKLKRFGVLGGDPFSDQYMRWYGYTFQRNSIRGGYWHEDIPYGYYESISGIEFFIN